MTSLFLLLLPVAAFSGWFVANKKNRDQDSLEGRLVPKNYLVGLNYLLNEQPDRAVDVFIKMLEVDSDTVETHLALGSLFRRRGEVDRAIRIHQNLIARPHLGKEQRTQALLALGQDYMRAGVLDRAERIFLEVVDSNAEMISALKYLLDIYQQEKAWERAIAIAKKLAVTTGDEMQTNIAHYYCELAQGAKLLKDSDQARRYIRKALSIDRQCVRASLLYGNIEYDADRFKAAIKIYKQVKYQNPNFLSEAIIPLASSYKRLGQESELLLYLQETLADYPRITLVMMLVEQLQRQEDLTAAIDFITAYLRIHPSIRGLQRLIELQMKKEGTQTVENLQILSDLTSSMLENKPIYRCGHCGFDGKSLHWLCPRCRRWSTFKPIQGLEGD